MTHFNKSGLCIRVRFIEKMNKSVFVENKKLINITFNHFFINTIFTEMNAENVENVGKSMLMS